MSLMNHIVPYVSSDEEGDKQVDSYSDWLEGVLDSSDDKPKVEVDDGDDDCVVLDGDPYKTKEAALDTCGTDEVVVLGQKGEIACRDFPHPRHACAKYPFKSTLHQKYCEMCHCYVCDIRAPCANWSMGFSNTDDHCHANDKEQEWKNRREWIRTGKVLSRPVSKPSSRVPEVSQIRFMQVPQNSSSLGTQFGFQPSSASSMVNTHPNSYIRPGYRAEQSRTVPQNLGLQPGVVQLFQNHRGGSRIGHPSPQVVSSNPNTWARTRSNGVYLGAQHTPYALPTPLQGNPQLIANGSISFVPESQNKEYYRHFNRNMYSCNVQTSAVPSGNPTPLARQQQQQLQFQAGRSNDKMQLQFQAGRSNDKMQLQFQAGRSNDKMQLQQQLQFQAGRSNDKMQLQFQAGRSNDKMLAEFEDWLMDNTAPTGHENATTVDWETFLR